MVIDQETSKLKTPDVEVFGDDLFLLLAKAESKLGGWMKSTKAMNCGRDVVVQVTTQFTDKDGNPVISEALTTVNDASIVEKLKDGVVVGRSVVKLGRNVQMEQQNPELYRAVN